MGAMTPRSKTAPSAFAVATALTTAAMRPPSSLVRTVSPRACDVKLQCEEQLNQCDWGGFESAMGFKKMTLASAAAERSPCSHTSNRNKASLARPLRSTVAPCKKQMTLPKKTFKEATKPPCRQGFQRRPPTDAHPSRCRRHHVTSQIRSR